MARLEPLAAAMQCGYAAVFLGDLVIASLLNQTTHSRQDGRMKIVMHVT
jgi:hypothetical protein